MGQYYKPIILESDRKTPVNYAYTHNVGCGLKLMEHSYFDNPVVNSVINFIAKAGGANLVWAGDYADPEPGTENEEFRDGLNLYSMTEGLPEMEYDTDTPNVAYLINEDKKEFVNLYNLSNLVSPVHPLPLLTVEGNGRGGGDYCGLNSDLVGRWARDFIVVSPGSYEKRKELEANYTEITPDFVETREMVYSLNTIAQLIKRAVARGDEEMGDKYNIEDLQKKVAELKTLVDTLA